MAPKRVALLDADTRAVLNIVLLDDADEVGPDAVVLRDGTAVDMGDTYDDATGSFSPIVRPVALEEARAAKLASLAQTLTEAQAAGTTFGGDRFATDNDSQLKFMGILLGAMLDPAYEIEFKTLDKTYVRFGHDEVIALCMTVKAHVTACFQNDRRLTEAIKAAGTVEELDAIDVSAGWPTPLGSAPTGALQGDGRG